MTIISYSYDTSCRMCYYFGNEFRVVEILINYFFKPKMNKKIYFIQPTYTNAEGELLNGKSLFVISLAFPSI
jgi:hypothetical protein